MGRTEVLACDACSSSGAPCIRVYEEEKGGEVLNAELRDPIWNQKLKCVLEYVTRTAVYRHSLMEQHQEGRPW